MIPLIIIEGPTASGKSRLALELAQCLDTEIISADSRQVYTKLNIGTAKPSPDELLLVKHHLIDIIDPAESYNAGRFVADAESAIQAVTAMGKIPIVCGGTGLYVRSLLEGLFLHPPIPAEIRATLRQRLIDSSIESLFSELQWIDPVLAGKISQTDTQRILRGLEVYYATGKPISTHWAEQAEQKKFNAFRILIDPPREMLYTRINERMDIMLQMGLLEEIRSLLESGYDASSPGLNSLGYHEYLPHLLEGTELSFCRDKAAQDSRNYAKRQCTWYRKYVFDLTIRDSVFTLSEIRSALSRRLYQ